MNKTLTDIKKEFEEKFVGLPSMYHTEDHQNIQGYYSDKMLNIKELWSWIESTISQTKKEIEDKYILECVKVAIRSHKIGYELGLKHGSKKTKQELIEEIKKELESYTHYYRSIFSRCCDRNETEEEKSTEMLTKDDVLKLLENHK